MDGWCCRSVPARCSWAREASTILCPCQAAGAPGARCRAAACPCLTSSSPSSSSSSPSSSLPPSRLSRSSGGGCDSLGTAAPWWPLERHRRGMPAVLPAPAALGTRCFWVSPVAFPGVSGWEFLSGSEVFFCPTSPCWHRGGPARSNPVVSISAPLSRALEGGSASTEPPPRCRGGSSQRQPVA